MLYQNTCCECACEPLAININLYQCLPPSASGGSTVVGCARSNKAITRVWWDRDGDPSRGVWGLGRHDCNFTEEENILVIPTLWFVLPPFQVAMGSHG